MALFKGENPALGDNVTINGSKPALLMPVAVPVTASTTSQTVYINGPVAYKIVGVRASFGTASTSGTLGVEVLTSGQASGAGTAVLSTPLSLSGAANTPVAGALASPVVPAGARIGIVVGGTMTNLAGGVVVITLQRA